MVEGPIRQVMRRYQGLSPEKVAELEEIEILYVDNMPGRFADAFILETIFLPAGLTTVERNWRIAHCLGHYFLHGGNQLWLQDNQQQSRSTQEREADTFGACLLTGEEREWTPLELFLIRCGEWRKP